MKISNTIIAALAVVAIGLLGGCNAIGSALPDAPTIPTGVRGTVTVQGSGTAQAEVRDIGGDYVPVTAEYRIEGNATAVAQWPDKPHLIIDADWGTNVMSPASVGNREIRDGTVLIRYRGAPAQMVPAQGVTVPGPAIEYAPPASFDPCNPSPPSARATAAPSGGCGCSLPSASPVARAEEAPSCPPVYVSPCGVTPPDLYSSTPHNTRCAGRTLKLNGECVKTWDRVVEVVGR